ncbi:MAG: DNA cytosine methyltransferase [Stellaceae bacterium]
MRSPKTEKAPLRNSAPTRLSAITLFAGAGGLHLGLAKAGFDVLVASDMSEYAEDTHKLNWPRTPFIRADIRRLSGRELLKATQGRKPDLIAGGPPCQGFSTLGDKISADPRNMLFAEFARIVDEISPRFVMVENVKALVTMYGGRFRDHIVSTFERLGFQTHWAILDAADYGVPQFRKRVVFFGTRHRAPFEFPTPTHGLGKCSPYATVWEAVRDLSKRGPEVASHIPLDHSKKVIARYKLIREGGRLPPPEQLPPGIRRKNFGNTYKRLHRYKPALTMVPGNNAFPVHPTLHRSLTPREAARLQTFPDTFLFSGDRRNQCILVGNAVPPRLGEVIGRAIIRHARRSKDKPAARQPSVPANQPPARCRPEPSTPRGDGMDRGVVDMFCGAGGFTVGFERAGWSPVIGIDINKFVAMTHEHNFPHIPYLSGDLSKGDVLDEVGRRFVPGSLAAVVGGPPCQGFSIFGKRRFVHTKGYEPHTDSRNKLVFAFIESVRRLQPRWFVMENVPGLANLDGGQFLGVVLEDLRGCGYANVEARILNAADFGVPQLRRRLLIIGNRTGQIIPWPKRKFFESPQEWQDRYRAVGEVLSDLADERSYVGHTCHVPMSHKPLLVERYRYIPEGGKLDVGALPAHLRSGYRTRKVKNYSHVFRRLHRDQPSITMVPGHNAFPIHPWLDRALTVREAARIQTFPDEIEFKGPRQEQCIQVGNAFPPLLAELIANNIKKAEVNGWYPGKVPPSAYYALVERPTPVQLDLIGDARDERANSTAA